MMMKLKQALFTLLFLGVFSGISGQNTVTDISPYQGVQEWVTTKDQRMDWYRKARFGMFIHWGLYAAAGGIWKEKIYPQHYSEWIETWAKVPSQEYASVLKPKFTASKFNADAIARLAKSAGMKYVVITSRHHEGFTIFNSRQPYSVSNPVTGSTNISPQGRDLYGELITAFKKQGLKAGAYYSLLDWQNPDSYEGFGLNTNTTDYKPDHQKYNDYMYGQIKELATNYPALDILWPDFSSQKKQGETWGTRRLLTDLIKWQPGIIISNRFWNGLENRNGDFGTPEKYVPPTGLPGMDWEVSHTMNESYGYSAHDTNWKSYDKMMRLFIETVSKGGNFLLNIGPDANGELPAPATQLLQNIGQWMAVNNEAIYETSASPFQSLSWGYCTQKKGKLYLQVFDVPANGELKLPLKNTIKKAYVLGSPQKLLLTKTTDESGIIQLPATFKGKQPMVVVAEISGPADVVESKVETKPDGRLELTADNARLSRGLRITGATTANPNRPNAIGGWADTKEVVYWNVKIQKPGKYNVLLRYKPAAKKSGTITIGLDSTVNTTYHFETEPTSDFKEVSVGSLEIPQQAIGASLVTIYMKAVSIMSQLPEISTVILVPAE